MKIVTRDAIGVYVEIGQRKGRILITWEDIGLLEDEKMARHLGIASVLKTTPEARRRAQEGRPPGPAVKRCKESTLRPLEPPVTPWTDTDAEESYTLRSCPM